MSINNIQASYISAGCNRCPKAVDWGGKQNQLISAVSNSVALYSNNEPYQIKCMFNKHTDRVNCVKWISAVNSIDRSKLKFNEFISASKDKTLVLWQGTDTEYEPVHTLTGHTDNICVIEGMYYKDEDSNKVNTYLASASVDSTVRIWSRQSDYDLNNEKDKFSEDQVILLKSRGFALALKFFILPISNLPLLLIGYENNKIEINIKLHNETDNANKFYPLHTLTGHEDWIRDIDICQISNEQLLIASSSQDNYIRLWKLDSSLTETKQEGNNGLIIEGDSVKIAESNDQSDSVLEDEELPNVKNEDELKLKSSLFTVHSTKLNRYVQYSMNLESVLYGHEDWIYTVKFHPVVDNKQPLVLLSASIDRTMVVWKFNEENNVWIDEARAGDIGGNTLGFYGATFDLSGQFIVAHGYQGAMHLWKRNAENESLTPGIINSGHFDLVEDICWEPDQKFFISTSKDQTTRFHGAWKSSPNNNNVTWHELGRPQIHGYDLKCCAFIDRFKFVTGADEKLLRNFEAPKIFLNNLYKLCLDESYLKLVNESTTMPQGASIPALGLSNKAVFEEKTPAPESDKRSLTDELYKEVYFNIIDLTKPPTEEHLLQNTLWPETQKLYGHGFEIFALAADPKNKIIASACKAAKSEHANIIIWQEQVSSKQMLYKQVDSLKGHELTIVQIKFSNNGNYLLSVSRDRSWKLFKRQLETNNNDSNPYFKNVRSISSKNGYHTRIIWSCDWSHDDKFFVTTSRDKRACIWYGIDKEDAEDKPVHAQNDQKPYLELESSITTSSFAPGFTANNQYLLAFGLETGKIEFYTWSPDSGFAKFGQVDKKFSHHLAVKRLSFRKIVNEPSDDTKKRSFCLASCSDDHSVRLFDIYA